MEYLIIGIFFFGVFLGYLIGLLHRHRLERSNDKLKATLVKKDLYIAELEKQVEFYIKTDEEKYSIAVLEGLENLAKKLDKK